MGELPILMCLAPCDPLAAVCPEGHTCVFVDPDDTASAHCVPQTMEASVGQACEDHDGCEPGTRCTDGGSLPGCVHDGCCSPYCNVADPLADAGCDAAILGTACTAVFPGGGEVGVCALP